VLDSLFGPFGEEARRPLVHVPREKHEIVNIWVDVFYHGALRNHSVNFLLEQTNVFGREKCEANGLRKQKHKGRHYDECDDGCLVSVTLTIVV